MDAWPRNIFAVTLFVEDLEASKRFYQDTFGLPVNFEDADSVVFDFNSTLINLLRTEAAPELLGSESVGPASAGRRFEFTILVEDVDATCQELTSRGVELLIEPVDRPWGLRTASFQDPDGNVWEIAQNLPGSPIDPDHVRRLLSPA